MRRIPELDGLRGIAISLVLFFHASGVNDALMSATNPAPAWLVRLAWMSWTGVDLFFVLSGFLIGGVLLNARTSPRYYSAFYGRRLHRIVPLAYLVLWLGIGLRGTSLNPFTPDIPTWSYALFVQNLFMAKCGYLGDWLSITWSLAIEEQFYLALPLLIRTTSERTLTRLLWWSLLVAPFIRTGMLLNGFTQAPYVLLPCRMDQLAMGVLLALGIRSFNLVSWVLMYKRQFTLLTLILAILVVVMSELPNLLIFTSIGYTLVGAFYGCLLLSCLAFKNSLPARLSRTKVLQRLGIGAYFLYLFHQLLLKVLPTISALATLFALAACSWRWLERPLIELGHRKFRYR